ncbi:MAG: hypothetical protein PHQ86_08075 [Dehalococcoidales bacterium]|nr:hypothetical protein [Dehalococcoidales bacterium]
MNVIKEYSIDIALFLVTIIICSVYAILPAPSAVQSVLIRLVIELAILGGVGLGYPMLYENMRGYRLNYFRGLIGYLLSIISSTVLAFYIFSYSVKPPYDGESVPAFLVYLIFITILLFIFYNVGYLVDRYRKSSKTMPRRRDDEQAGGGVA